MYPFANPYAILQIVFQVGLLFPIINLNCVLPVPVIFRVGLSFSIKNLNVRPQLKDYLTAVQLCWILPESSSFKVAVILYLCSGPPLLLETQQSSHGHTSGRTVPCSVSANRSNVK